MDFPDDRPVEKEAKQDGKQGKKRFHTACIRIASRAPLIRTLRYGIFADFFGYDAFPVFKVKGVFHRCILPYATDHCDDKKCAHKSLCD
ncbi:hypothetical protein [Bilophila sp.]|uniref:hypothetical protein n=1 Tax=Bilophila sp. TaxID=1929485 RepID=UPI003077C0ED